MPNKLQTETSPYLLQHQNNPVNWHPWHKDSLEKAREENKLILVSIGYSACHWCHVMERESFEDKQLADLLNQHFVSIKVDREERPDIDQLYMLALQLISGQGGWPLNMICLPDGRPVYGGTYFPKENFIAILEQLQDRWEHQPDEMFDYASRLTAGVQQAERLNLQTSEILLKQEELQEIVTRWSLEFDPVDGGFSRVPKFPLPGSWLFFLRYGHRHKESKFLDQVHLTLTKMANGGLYDQIGGGFSRYSVDGKWRVPHFEKMLYDNAQLLSVYSEAYQQKPTALYKQVIEETIAWLVQDMQAPSGGFYSALDADSEGEEGKYYTFTYAEFQDALGPEDAKQYAPFFQVSQQGNWAEEQTNVLQGNLEWAISDETEEKKKALKQVKSRLLGYRKKRKPPGLDHKILCSWNAMLVSGLCDAYGALRTPTYLEMAGAVLDFIDDNLVGKQGQMLRLNPVHGRPIDGFLDDYAFYIKALIDFYQVSFQETVLKKAYTLMQRAIEDFYEVQAGAFYYTSRYAETLIARKTELMDDVIPSSNSVMIQQLDKLGVIFEEPEFEAMARTITQHMIPQVRQYPSAFSGWLLYLDNQINSRYEIALCGPGYREMHTELLNYYIPNKILMGGAVSDLPFLKGKINDRDQAYLCKDKSCKAPVSSLPELINLIFEPERKR